MSFILLFFVRLRIGIVVTCDETFLVLNVQTHVGDSFPSLLGSFNQ